MSMFSSWWLPTLQKQWFRACTIEQPIPNNRNPTKMFTKRVRLLGLGACLPRRYQSKLIAIFVRINYANTIILRTVIMCWFHAYVQCACIYKCIQTERTYTLRLYTIYIQLAICVGLHHRPTLTVLYNSMTNNTYKYSYTYYPYVIKCLVNSWI